MKCAGQRRLNHRCALPPGEGFDGNWYELGQGVDMTGLPSGTYRLDVILDSDELLTELDWSNNVSLVELELRADEGVAPTVEVLD